MRDEATANWVVRKIIEARAYAERVKAYAERELKRTQRQEQFFLKQYGPELEAWARQQIAQRGGRLKQVRLPAGAVGYRAAGARLTVADDDLLLEWCRVHLPDAVVRTERVIKSLVNDHLRRTGECPDGADIVPAADRFYVK